MSACGRICASRDRNRQLTRSPCPRCGSRLTQSSRRRVLNRSSRRNPAMSDVSLCLWLIPGLPLLASVLIAAFGRQLKGLSHWPCILAGIGSCICSFVVFSAVQDLPLVSESANAGAASYLEVQTTWIKAGKLDIPFILRADGLTALMLVTVTFIGSLIAIFALGYLHGREGYPRFFARISLFIFSITGLVLAGNFLVLYAFWEGVGLCSYLLIGFWVHKPSAAAAARKAFLVTRLGDAGFLVGIMLLWVLSGYSLNYEKVFAHPPSFDPNLRLTACLLLFCGAVGKSAQFPLYVWLPDAMDGPTPVSALIHAATMVTAGVYLVAR